MSLVLFGELSKDIGELLENGTNSDVIIQAGEGSTYKEFRVHSLILSARSTYFRTAFSNNWAKKVDSFIVFKKPNISATIFDVILEYLYKAIIDLDKLNGSEILQLLIAADEFGFSTLTDKCRSFLIEKQDELLDKDPVGLLQISLQHEPCAVLRESLVHTICKNVGILQKDPLGLLKIILQHETCVTRRDYFIQTICKDVTILKKDLFGILQVSVQNGACTALRDLCIKACCTDTALFESPSFLNLNKQLLIMILQQNYIELDEIQIWNYLLKWGVARSSALNLENKNEWKINEFRELRNILRDLIPLIRWHQISAVDFQKEIMFFKSILSEDLFLDVISYHLNPNMTFKTVILPPRFDSLIIDYDQAIKITRRAKNNSFKLSFRNIFDGIEASKFHTLRDNNSFKLLYRASRNGFEASKFHTLCDNKGATFFVAKCQGFNKIIGGYNPFSWKTYGSYSNSYGSWENTTESFLFLSSDNYLDIIDINQANSTYAVSYSIDKGPCFGAGRDLEICNDRICFNGSTTYPKLAALIGDREFIMEDYEVYQLL
ncbi:701_t:CDS:2 [Acaulospora morrowiae]|uniref:701_t:CDS:1 n=1 Tax=Acaulospora morrowiae TaxID=94023 RepID=A0A9N9D5R5_9GLOM|nr:701_t:CDS:2 [Acaulospora morrowiae]